MKKLIKQYDIHFKGLMGALLGSIIFFQLGNFIPHIYYKYIDNTDYYLVKEISLDTYTVKKCETIIIRITRDIKIDTLVDYVDELILQDKNKEVYRYVGEAAWTKGLKSVELPYQIPCNIESGEYIISSTSNFKIYDVEKHEYFETPKFVIVE